MGLYHHDNGWVSVRNLAPNISLFRSLITIELSQARLQLELQYATSRILNVVFPIVTLVDLTLLSATLQGLYLFARRRDLFQCGRTCDLF